MNFFFKRKKKVVDCFTPHQMVYEHFPIMQSKEFIPQWYKKLSPTYKVGYDHTAKKEAATIKRCPGISNLFSEGFILPLWSDLSLQFDASDNNNFDMKYEYAATDTSWGLEVHDNRQYLGLFDNNFFQAKLSVPWIVKESTGLKFAFIEPTYTMSNPNIFTIIPGLLNFKYQNFLNVNMMIEVTHPMNKTINIEAGEPLAQIIPLSEDDVELRVHKVSSEEYKSLDQSTQSFSWFGTYYNRKK
jgi:hypothetical protein